MGNSMRAMAAVCASVLLVVSQGLPAAGEGTGRSGVARGDPLQRDFTLPVPLFAPNSPWNQTATQASTLSTSEEQILVTYRVLRGDKTSLHGIQGPNWPFMVVNYDDYTVPVFRMGSTTESVVLRDYAGNLRWPGHKYPDTPLGGPVSLPAPAGTVRPSGPTNIQADGHLVLYDPATAIEYDFWDATTARDPAGHSLGGGQLGTAILETGAIDFFDVRGTGTEAPTYSSARATGTPLLAGLILPEDVESGVVAHALGFVIPGPRNTSAKPSEPLPSDYFYPASMTETDFYNTNPLALAAGQRIRLKQTIVNADGNPITDEKQLAPITRMLLTALRTYGAYLVDGAGGFGFYAEDIHTANLHLTDDQVNALIGQPAGTALPTAKTKWQVVIEKLNQDLGQVPIAYGPWQDGQDPATATITVSNFEVVDPASASGLPHTVAAITPNAGLNNGSVTISNLSGTGFAAGATVRLTRTGQSDITATNISVVSANKITCTFNLTGRATGKWNVVVTNPDGQKGTLANGFTVSQGGVVHDVAVTNFVVSPNPVSRGSTIAFNVSVKNLGTTTESGVTFHMTYNNGKTLTGPTRIPTWKPGQEFSGSFRLGVPRNLATGDYLITGELSPVSGEINTDNNKQTLKVTVK